MVQMRHCVSTEGPWDDWLGVIKLDQDTVVKYCDGQSHPFVVMDAKMMLVERCGDYYERTAPGTM